MVDENRDRDRDEQTGEGGEMRAHMEKREEAEQRGDGQQGDERGDADAAERRIDLRPMHGERADARGERVEAAMRAGAWREFLAGRCGGRHEAFAKRSRV